jgi:hypothetical protein
MTNIPVCGCTLQNCFHAQGQCTRVANDSGLCDDCHESRSLNDRIEIRTRQLVEQQTGFDLDGELDDPELIDLDTKLKSLKARNR